MAVLGVVMLLFVVFQLWGTGLQQAQAQSDLEVDLAERFRRAAEAGQGPRRAVGRSDPTDPGVPARPESTGATNTDDATGDREPTADATDDATGGREPTEPTADATDDATGGGEPSEPPGSAVAAAGGDPGAGAAAQGQASTLTGAAAQGQAGTPTGGGSAAAGLPEYLDLPHVVRHISEPAGARSTARLLDPGVEELLPLVYPAGGEAIARIIIPSIDLDEVVVSGVGTDDLRKGPGHYSTTPLPGQPGNAAIAGHRTTYGAPFGRLAELAEGDSIIVETLQGHFVYRVLAGDPGPASQGIGFRIVAPTALEVLDDAGDNRLTLTSCHPKYSSRQRIVVHAALTGDPVVRLPRPGEPIGAEFVQLAEPQQPQKPQQQAPAAPTGLGPPETRPAGGDDAHRAALQTTEEPDGEAEEAPATTGSTGGQNDPVNSAPADSAPSAPPSGDAAPRTSVAGDGFGEGLSGDGGAIVPAVLWGLAASAVWAAGLALGRSGRRWLRYSAAAVLFLVVLYPMFVYIDRALPAY